MADPLRDGTAKRGAGTRPEAAFVLLLLQSLSWAIAGLSAAPFALAGETSLAWLALATLLLATGTCLGGIGVLRRRSGACGAVIALEVACLAGTALLGVLPIGFNIGLVSILVNAVLPLGVIVLVSKGREAFT